MKRITIILLALMITIFASGCGKSTADYSDDEKATQVQEETQAVEEKDMMFKSSRLVVKVGDKYICTDGKKVYLRSSMLESGTVLAEEDKIDYIMSDGKIVYFTSMHGNDSDYSIYSVDTNGENLKKLFDKKDMIFPVTCVDNCFYYIDCKFEDKKLTKYDISKDEHTELVSVTTAYAMGNKIYYAMDYATNTPDLIGETVVEAIDLKTEETEEVATSSTLFRCSYTEDALCFKSFAYESIQNEYGSYESRYFNQYVYTVDKNNNVTKSEKLPDTSVGFTICDNGKFVILNDEEDPGKVYKRYDLENKTEVKQINESVLDAVAYEDIANPGDVYLLGNLEESLTGSRKVLMNKVTPEGGSRCYLNEERIIELDGYDNCVVDGLLIDKKLNVYEITTPHLENYDRVIEEYVNSTPWEWPGTLEIEEFKIDIECYAEKDLDDVGYALKDLDDNGVDELLIGPVDNDGDIYTAFSLADGELVLLFMSWSRSNNYLMDNGNILNNGSGGAAVSVWDNEVISDNKREMVLEERVTSDGIYAESIGLVDNAFDYNPDKVWFRTTDPDGDNYVNISEKKAKKKINAWENSKVHIEYTPLSEYAK